jgi:hypothetical protein
MGRKELIMDLIDESFIKYLSSKISETSSIVQLQELFIKNKKHCYSERVSNLFMDKSVWFEQLAADNFTRSQCERLKEDVECELDFISKTSAKKVEDNFINFYMQFQTREGRILDDCLRELFKLIIKKTSGRKKEACRILGITEEQFNIYSDNTKEIKAFTRNYKKEVRSTKAKDIRGNVD